VFEIGRTPALDRHTVPGRVEVPRAARLDHVRVGCRLGPGQVQVFPIVRASGSQVVDRPDLIGRDDRGSLHVHKAIFFLIGVVELRVAVPVDVRLGLNESGGPAVGLEHSARLFPVVPAEPAVFTDQERLAPIQASLPTGYFIHYSGQFESQQSATRTIGLLSLVSLACMILALYTLFHSVNLSLQVLAALPMAAIGAVGALVITGQSLTVASMVGFISLAGIASRNGILLITHYLHLVRHEGEDFTPQMVERAGKERLAPMMMTALCAGIALIPLALAAGQPGKEILYPVATVILGGLISCTLLDFFVRPALFWTFGRKAAAAALKHHHHEPDLKDTESQAKEDGHDMPHRMGTTPDGERAGVLHSQPVSGDDGRAAPQ